MARCRQQADWQRTALLAAIGANPFRDTQKRKEPFTPNDFNPFVVRKIPKIEKAKIKVSVECLKGLCKGEGKNTGH